MLCMFCNKVFITKEQIYNHTRRCSKNPSLKTFACKVCGKSFIRKAHLNDHSCQGHNIGEYFVFSSMEEFERWKLEMETKTFSYYPRSTGEKRNKYLYFKCQHDTTDRYQGTQPTSSRKATLKRKVKANKTCPSMIKVKKDNESINVLYFSSHSHPLDKSDLKHQPRLETKKKQQRKRLLLEKCKELIQLIENDKVPEICMSHVIEVLSQLLAECQSYGAKEANITSTSIKTTINSHSLNSNPLQPEEVIS